ncbi:hypothetical protein XGA_3803 [Xanthomonas hortorum ATCC 19865]|nr:hypothetical protein XGA_3803 [Xanthomonas hortorum ATCC 19865]
MALHRTARRQRLRLMRMPDLLLEYPNCIPMQARVLRRMQRWHAWSWILLLLATLPHVRCVVVHLRPAMRRRSRRPAWTMKPQRSRPNA